MFDATSRYARQPTVLATNANGRPCRYVTLRELPGADVAGPTELVHVVGDNDRVDRIAWLRLGDPQLFWVVCDANGVLHPDELVRRGRRIRIPGQT